MVELLKEVQFNRRSNFREHKICSDANYTYYVGINDYKIYVTEKDKLYTLHFDEFYNRQLNIKSIFIHNNKLFVMCQSENYVRVYNNSKLVSKLCLSAKVLRWISFVAVNNYLYLFNYCYGRLITLSDIQIIIYDIGSGSIIRSISDVILKPLIISGNFYSILNKAKYHEHGFDIEYNKNHFMKFEDDNFFIS